MIGYVKGTLEELRSGRAVIDVNGFGVIVLVPDSGDAVFPSIGNEIKLYTHLAVREDDMSLYGFLSRDSLDLFEKLITVSGVGPKVALGILGTYSVSDIVYYIRTESSDKLSKAPGIGKKTAERIIIDLKDKFKDEDILTLSDFEGREEILQDTEESGDAVAALVALGYGLKEAKAAVNRIGDISGMDTNAILKAALPYLI